MEHVTTIQEILKWFAGICLIMMGAFIVFGWFKGLNMEYNLKAKRKRISY
jgi:putative Mn2+ efflux pump MntP